MPTTTVSPIEARVRSRMDAEKLDLGNQINDHLNQRDSAVSDHDHMLLAAKTSLEVAQSNPDATEVQTAALQDAYKQATKAALKAITEASKARALQGKLAALDTDEEFQRRVAAASDVASGRKMSLREATIRTLIARDPNSEGMNYRALWEAIAEMALVEPKGKTPHATLNAMLAVDAAKHEKGEAATFKRTDPSTFALIDKDAAQAALPPREGDEEAAPEAAPEATEPTPEAEAPAKPKRSRGKKAETSAQASE